MRGFLSKTFQEQLRVFDQEKGIDHRLDFWVEQFGGGAGAWLLWNYRKQIHNAGAVDFQIPREIPTPNWMRVALEAIKRLPYWSVNIVGGTKDPMRRFRVRWHRHGHFKRKPSLPPEQLS
jgi:hypothetical protein